jgi:spermidine dehydrogenase
MAENNRYDKILGMEEGIDRRDFLNAVLLGSGSVLLGSWTPAQILAADDWTGYGGVGDYARSNGNTQEVIKAGHEVRDRTYTSKPQTAIETGEVYDCVIVGGGLSGLGTALHFQNTAPQLKCLILENHPIFGGEAKGNEFLVGGQRLMAPQGSDHFGTPAAGTSIAKLYESIGVDPGKFEYQTWSGPQPEVPVGRSFEHIQAPYGLYFGASQFGLKQGMWLIDPWGKKLEGSPLSAKMCAEILRYREEGGATRGQRPPELDRITMEQFFMDRFGMSQETVRTFFTPGPGDGHGIGPDVLSAYAFGFGADPMNIGLDRNLQSFPGGNAGFARHIVKTLLPESIPGQRTLEDVCNNHVDLAALDRPGLQTRIRTGSTVVAVKHEDGDPVRSQHVSVQYTRGGKLYHVRGRSAIMAGGNWTTKHIVLDLPASHREAYNQFHRSPCMLANIALHNWRFLYKLGVSGAFWFSGLGNYASIRKVPTFSTKAKTIGPDSPVVMTLKVLFCRPGLTMEEQQAKGRAELLATSYREYERKIREQMIEMFSGTGFDAKRDIAGIILNRWGHAYASPQPGFFFGNDGKGSPRDILRDKAFGRIAFANTDLAGNAGHTIAINEGIRAANQLLDGALKG